MNTVKVAKLAGVSEARVLEFVNYDWSNAEEHVEWVQNAHDEEIADWIASQVERE